MHLCSLSIQLPLDSYITKCSLSLCMFPFSQDHMVNFLIECWTWLVLCCWILGFVVFLYSDLCDCWLVYSVQFSRSVMSDFLQPYGMQHARLPCPSLTPGACSKSCPSSWWCHPTISSSVIPFSSCLQSCPASGSFPMSQFFTSGGQNIGISASVLLVNIQDWFPLGWTGWISLQSKGLSRVFSNTIVQKHQFLGTQLSLNNSHIHTWLLEKTIALTR